MTRRELELREKAVLAAYNDNNIEKAANIMLDLYLRKPDMKLYRFRPPKQHEITAIHEAKIYLSRPRVYEDLGDCQWIDNMKALVEYEVRIWNHQKYFRLEKQFTPQLCSEIEKGVLQNPRYIKLKDTVRNMCFIACITDKMTDYM